MPMQKSTSASLHRNPRSMTGDKTVQGNKLQCIAAGMPPFQRRGSGGPRMGIAALAKDGGALFVMHPRRIVTLGKSTEVVLPFC